MDKDKDRQYIEPLFKGTNLENGYGFVSREVLRDKNIGKNAKLIYSYLMSFAGNKFSAFPGRSIIMDETGISSKDTYHAALNELQRLGLVTVEQKKAAGESGKIVYKGNVFTMNIKREEIERAKTLYTLSKIKDVSCPKNQDTKEDVPCPDFQDPQNQDPENQDPQKQDINSNSLNSNNSNNNSKKNSNSPSSFLTCFNLAKDYLRGSMEEISYNTWINSLTLKEAKDDIFTIKTGSSFHKNIIESRFTDSIKEALAKASGHQTDIKII